MAITPAVATALGGTTTTTSFTITIPNTVNDGDLLTVWFTHRGTGNGAVADNSGVGSWTRKGGIVFGSFSVQCYYKRVTVQASERGATITGSSLTDSCAGVMIADRGVVASGDPFEAFTGESNASGNESHAEITTTTAGALVGLAVGNSPDLAVATQSSTSPGTLTERAERLSTGGTDSSISVASEVKASPGATGALTWAQTNAAAGSLAFALTPEPEPPLDLGSSTARATALRVVTAGILLVAAAAPSRLGYTRNYSQLSVDSGATNAASVSRATTLRSVSALTTHATLASTSRGSQLRAHGSVRLPMYLTSVSRNGWHRASHAGIILVAHGAPTRFGFARNTSQLTIDTPSLDLASVSRDGWLRSPTTLASEIALASANRAGWHRGSSQLQMQGSTAALASVSRASALRALHSGIVLAHHGAPARLGWLRSTSQLTIPTEGGVALTSVSRASALRALHSGLVLAHHGAPARLGWLRSTSQLTIPSEDTVALASTARAGWLRTPFPGSLAIVTELAPARLGWLRSSSQLTTADGGTDLASVSRAGWLRTPFPGSLVIAIELAPSRLGWLRTRSQLQMQGTTASIASVTRLGWARTSATLRTPLRLSSTSRLSWARFLARLDTTLALVGTTRAGWERAYGQLSGLDFPFDLGASTSRLGWLRHAFGNRARVGPSDTILTVRDQVTVLLDRGIETWLTIHDVTTEEE